MEALPRRPANAQVAIDLQSCRTDLHNTRLTAAELGRKADTSAQALSALSTRALLLAKLQAAIPAANPAAPANLLFAVSFSRGSSQVTIPPELAANLADQVATAPWIVLRGAGDASSATPDSLNLAIARTTAIRQHLIAAGADPARIRSTVITSVEDGAPQDPANAPEARVEIEVYRSTPRLVPTVVATRP